MVSPETKVVVERAKHLYATRWQQQLEAQHRDRYVAVEPIAGEYFLGDSFDDAVSLARAAYPDRISFVIRVGHEAAIHTGLMELHWD